MPSQGYIKPIIVIGGAQGINIAISIVRQKVLAILLGPSGIGLLSIFINLQGMASTFAGLGMGSSGVRQLASVKGEERELSQVRRVLLGAHLMQGALALLGVYMLRAPIAVWILGDAAYATEVGLIGVAVLLTLVATAQTTLLQGLRRIGELGWVTVMGSLAATITGVAAVWLFGHAGLIWFVLMQPLSTFIVAIYFTRRLPQADVPRFTVTEMWKFWKPMAKIGSAFMLGGLATGGTLLLTRARIIQELGPEAAGHFAAAWSFATIYVGFLLSAMMTDYFPRLSEVIKDHAATANLMNDQVQITLAIGGPILLLLIGLAPWMVVLLYSPEFSPAASLLQWQTVGNVFKLASWPLGFALAAAARSKTFLLVQLNFNFLFLALLWPTLSDFGIFAAGPAFTFGYMAHFILMIFLVRHFHGFRWQSLSLIMITLYGVLALALLGLAQTHPFIAAIASPIAALSSGFVGLRVVLMKTDPEGRIAKHLIRGFAAIGWPVPSSS